MRRLACCDGITRRDTLRAGALGAIGLTLADYLRLAEASTRKPAAEAALFIHLEGGPSHLDTLDMKPEAPAEERGPFQSIPSRLDGVRICEHLPRLAGALDRFALLRGLSHSAGSHPQANEYLFTGNRPSPAVSYPSLGSVISRERPSPSDLPGFVAVPTTSMHTGFLGVAHAPFRTTRVPAAGKPFEVRGLGQAIPLDRLRNRDRLLQDLDRRFRAVEERSPVLAGLDRFGRQAQEILLSPRVRTAFDTGLESPQVVRRFGADDFGQSLLLAARLIEHGVRFVTVSFGGWDTHLDNFPLLKNRLLPQFDAGITALVEVLEEKGLLRRTLVVAGGEFGRTPTINKNGGRDHWPRAGWMLLAGGGVRAGQAIGGTDRKGHGPDESTRLTPDDLAASIYRLLGIDPLKEYHTPGGRPVPLVPQGRVIPGLLEV